MSRRTLVRPSIPLAVRNVFLSSRDQENPVFVNDASNAARALLPEEAELVIEHRPAGAPAPVRSPRPAPYFIRDVKGLVRIDLKDLHYLQAAGNYVEVHFDDQRVVLRQSLSEVLRALPEGALVQINRAQAVNTSRIAQIGTDNLLVGDRVFSLSSLYRESLLRQLRIISDR